MTHFFSHSKLYSLFLAQTHVSYEVKGDVAVIRINDPNSKVCVRALIPQKRDSCSPLKYASLMCVYVCEPDGSLLSPGKHAVDPNAKGDGGGIG